MPQPAPSPIPEGMRAITAHLWFDGNAQEAIAWYQKNFNASLTSPPITFPGGVGIMHAMLKIGDSHIMMADQIPGKAWEHAPKEGSTMSLFVYVDDCDAYYDRAIAEGSEVLEEMMDAFWGDRMGKIKDPFGHVWAFATHQWVLSPEEMQERMASMG